MCPHATHTCAEIGSGSLPPGPLTVISPIGESRDAVRVSLLHLLHSTISLPPHPAVCVLLEAAHCPAGNFCSRGQRIILRACNKCANVAHQGHVKVTSARIAGSVRPQNLHPPTSAQRRCAEVGGWIFVSDKTLTLPDCDVPCLQAASLASGPNATCFS